MNELDAAIKNATANTDLLKKILSSNCWDTKMAEKLWHWYRLMYKFEQEFQLFSKQHIPPTELGKTGRDIWYFAMMFELDVIKDGFCNANEVKNNERIYKILTEWTKFMKKALQEACVRELVSHLFEGEIMDKSTHSEVEETLENNEEEIFENSHRRAAEELLHKADSRRRYVRRVLCRDISPKKYLEELFWVMGKLEKDIQLWLNGKILQLPSHEMEADQNFPSAIMFELKLIKHYINSSPELTNNESVLEAMREWGEFMKKALQEAYMQKVLSLLL